LEPEVLGPALDAIAVAIQGRARHARPGAIEVPNGVDLADLGLELERQFIRPLGPSAHAARGHLGVVGIVAAGRDSDVINAVAQRRGQSRIGAEVVVIA